MDEGGSERDAFIQYHSDGKKKKQKTKTDTPGYFYIMMRMFEKNL